MKSRFGNLPLFGMFSLLAIGMLGYSVHEYRGTVKAYSNASERIRPQLVRLEINDRLTGARIPNLQLAGLDGERRQLLPDGSGPSVLWLLKIKQCPSCLEQRLARWHYLVGNSELTGRIILVGASLANAREIAAGAGIRTEVLVDTFSVAASRLGLRAPSAGFVVDHNGMVMLADARFIGTTSRCGWGFFQQVHAIFGGGDPERIRAVALSSP